MLDSSVEIVLVLIVESANRLIPKQSPMSDNVSTVKFLFPERLIPKQSLKRISELRTMGL